MFPVLFKVFGVTISTYGFMYALGLGIAVFASLARGKKEGIEVDDFADLLFWTIIVGILGAKILLIITDIDILYTEDAFINILRSGGVFYGGIIFGVPFGIWFAKHKGLPIAKITDIIAPFIALAHFFGRLGCFSAGCCYGRETNSFLGVKFTNKIAWENTGVPLGKKIYPTQLMEAILNLINFIVLFIFYKKRKNQGEVFTLYVVNYAIIRFFVEYFRGDPGRGYIWGGIENPWVSLSVSQLISIIALISGIFIFYRLRKK